MKKQAITILLLTAIMIFGAASCPAQQVDFGVQAISGPDGVLLLIGGDMLCPATASSHDGWIGYNIYRRESGKNKLKKINDKPISRVSTLDDLGKLLGVKVDLALKFLKLTRPDELWTLIENNDDKIMVLSLLDLDYRVALGLAYRDTKVKNQTHYAYTIKKVDSKGKESSPSAESQVTYGTPPYELQGPLNAKAEIGDNEVRLYWQVNPADSGVFSYSIYRAINSKGPLQKLNDKPVMIFFQENAETVPEGSYTDKTAKNSVAYYYAVVSVDIAGNESPKEPLIRLIPRDNQPPASPQGVAAKSGDMGIIITWHKGQEDDLAGYNIYRSLIPDSQFVKINDVIAPPDTGLYIDHAALPGIQYYYRITALDRTGNESEQSPTAFTLFQNLRAPLPPQDVIAKGIEDGVLISWSPGSESDLRGYYVFRANSATAKPVQVSPLLAGDTTSFTDRDGLLSPKGTYWYYVKSLNYPGVTSDYSIAATATPVITILPEPPLSFYGYQDAIGNRLFWDLPMDNTIVGYNIYRAVKADSLIWEKIVGEPIAWKIRNYTDTTAQISIDYVYRIISVNSQGIEGKPSHTISLNLFTPPPLPPGNVMVTKAVEGIKISWDVSMEGDAAGYIVYRRVSGTPVEKLTLTVLPVGQSQYIDTSAKTGTRYFYSISCLDNSGREGAHSKETAYYYQ